MSRSVIGKRNKHLFIFSPPAIEKIRLLLKMKVWNRKENVFKANRRVILPYFRFCGSFIAACGSIHGATFLKEKFYNVKKL